MPRMCWIVLLGTMLLGSQLAAGSEPLLPASTCPCQVKGCAQPGGAGVPGCCEERRHCFDNAWDGYCQERARVDAFWSKVGTGAFLAPSCCTVCNRCGALVEIRLRPAAAACGCQASPVAIPAPAGQR